ncbi:hypothetical protein ACIQUF_08920 [Pseudomonas sp. NPDC090233]|uniref:hypothetical protein n=1 Tax=Pseudomonas sp. NPDC090233 TaxID=3364479 RepID=UPI00383B8DCE
MAHSPSTNDTIEIVGTVVSPALPNYQESHGVGAPRIDVKLFARSDKQVFSTLSLQASGSPVTFHLSVPRKVVEASRALALMAECTPYTGDETIIANVQANIDLNDTKDHAPFELILQPTSAFPHNDPGKEPGTTSMHTLHGSVNIPPNCQHADATLQVGLYLVQEDGESNQYSSNIAEYQAAANQPTVNFALAFDSNTFPSGQILSISAFVYDHRAESVCAGRSIDYPDLASPPDLSSIELTLRADTDQSH